MYDHPYMGDMDRGRNRDPVRGRNQAKPNKRNPIFTNRRKFPFGEIGLDNEGEILYKR